MEFWVTDFDLSLVTMSLLGFVEQARNVAWEVRKSYVLTGFW